MHSAAGIEDRLFTPARIRLTAWYVGVLAAVLVVLGTALYLVVRNQLLNSVDNGVKLVAARQRAVDAEAGSRRGVLTGPYTVNMSRATSYRHSSRWEPHSTRLARRCAAQTAATSHVGRVRRPSARLLGPRQADRLTSR